jgi:hypothetical protein
MGLKYTETAWNGNCGIEKLGGDRIKKGTSGGGGGGYKHRIWNEVMKATVEEAY